MKQWGKVVGCNWLQGARKGDPECDDFPSRKEPFYRSNRPPVKLIEEAGAKSKAVTLVGGSVVRVQLN